MARHTLKDHHNRTIGYIEEQPSSRRVKITDAGSATLGWYIPDRDVTTDASWRVIGKGNQLLMLLPTRSERIRLEPVR